MVRSFLLGLLFFMCFHGMAQRTRFETSEGTETPEYHEIINFYHQLDTSSDLISVKEMGATDAAYPLHLAIVSADKQFDPVTWHRQRKVVILINNGIHPGEPDGIDASMLLLRDITTGKVMVPANVVLAIIPVYNIGGCLQRNSTSRVNQNGPGEYGFRGNSQNLDLNRDFTKCDTREAKSFTEIFHYLNPDILIDNHVSDGADYQHTMTLITTQYNKLGPSLGKWLKDSFEPEIYKSMQEKRWDLIPYVDFSTTNLNEGLQMFIETPRYSSGYAALFNTLSFIPETHMLKSYPKRVRATYDLMISFINTAAAMATEIKKERSIAQALTLQQKEFPLRWTPDTSNFSQITFKGYETRFTTSEATGLQKMMYDHVRPYTKTLKFYDVCRPANIILAPAAYIIPAGWWEVVDRLKLNRVTMRQLEHDSNILVTSYHIDEYKSLPQAYEKHHKNYSVKTSSAKEMQKFRKGDYVVDMSQPSRRYIVEMLEPTGDDSFFAWNFFDGILQQKEGYSDYRWETIAAEVLRLDSGLRMKVEQRKAADPAFAADASAILNFIYKSSPYYEKVHLKYPVYRVEN